MNDKCEEKVAENCTTLKGYEIQKDTIEYTQRQWQKTICWPCQIKLGIARGKV